jgi:ribosomal protein S18 acetylase RimI-like enzyme
MSELEAHQKHASTDSTPAVTFRPVQAGDEHFLFIVYASTRMDELAQVPWNEAQREAFLQMQFNAQQTHYQRYYPDASHELILLRDEPIGRVLVDRTEQDIRIIDLTILPEFRNAGIGTPILKDLQAEGARAGRALTIYVESFNRSLRLFDRLGFHKIGDEGIYFLLKWQPEEGKR